jgi:putrescine transport system ATP-binding protein
VDAAEGRSLSASPGSPEQPPYLRLERIGKRYDATAAVDAINLDIDRGEVFCLLGESGSGKTTLLRMLAGFVMPDAGRVILDGVDITDWPPYRRPVNMMFQSYALFPHMTVSGNIRFGMEREGLEREEIARRLEEVLGLLRLDDLASRRPHQLSGGQQQRVALARCLVKRPRVLLLDEPLAALDRKLREATQYELLRLQQELGITFVIVTHDQDEAMTMAHRVGVMRSGRLEQVGTPRQIYDNPDSRFVAEFVGSVNLLDGQVTGQRDGLVHVASDGWRDEIRVLANSTYQIGQQVSVAVRPERLRFLTGEDVVDETFSNALVAVVEQRMFRGDQSAYVVRTDTRTLHATIAHAATGSQPLPDVGDTVRVAFAPDGATVLDR